MRFTLGSLITNWSSLQWCHE